MKLTRADITNIAALARLDLSETEKQMYADQLSVVLDYMEMLNEVDTEGVEETCQVTGLKNVVRQDEIIECDSDVRKKIISQFPDKKENLLKVKAVFVDEN